MTQNVDDFNTGVAIIMGKLYQCFPTPITLQANELPQIDYLEDDPQLSEKCDEWVRLSNLYFHTSLFLLEEGYIRGEKADGYIYLKHCTLTSKGLSALQKVPSSLKGKKRSAGEWLTELGKDSAKEVTKEAVKSVVRAVLSGG